MSVDILQEKIKKCKCPLVLALDMRPGGLPPKLLEQAGSPAAACEAFGLAVLDAAADRIPAVKFNTAWYTALGGRGFSVLSALIAAAKKRGLYVLVESMRSDTGEGAAICAETYYELLGSDGVCAGAFTGSDGIRPYIPYCEKQGKSLFVLARTANASAWEVQDLLSGDRVVHTAILDLVTRWNGNRCGASGYAGIGAVVAAKPAGGLRQKYSQTFFLVQGCTSPRDARLAFDEFGHGAMVETPGSVLTGWRDAENGAERFAESVRGALDRFAEGLGSFVRVVG